MAPLLAQQMWDAPGSGWAMVGGVATAIAAVVAVISHLRALRKERLKAREEAQKSHDEEVRTKTIAEQLALAQKAQVAELVAGQHETLDAVKAHGGALNDLGDEVRGIGSSAKRTADELHSHVEASNAQFDALSKKIAAHDKVIDQIPAFAEDLKFVKSKLQNFGRQPPAKHP